MGYAKEFNHLEYNVPEFLLTDAGWEDVSWHNDVCPRWENRDLYIAVWVDCNELACREYEDWKQYTVAPIIVQFDGSTLIGDETLFSTERADVLLSWIQMYEIKQYIELAIAIGNHMEEQPEEVADGLVSTLEWLNVYMAPDGEPC